MSKWDDYTEKRDLMFERTHIEPCAMDHRARQRQAPRAPRRHPPHPARRCPMPIATWTSIGKQDGKIIGEGPSFLGG